MNYSPHVDRIGGHGWAIAEAASAIRDLAEKLDPAIKSQAKEYAKSAQKLADEIINWHLENVE